MTMQGGIRPGYQQTEVGVIPEDWEVKTLGDVANIATGNTPSTSDASNYGDEFLFVGPVDMGGAKFVSKTGGELSAKKLRWAFVLAYYSAPLVYFEFSFGQTVKFSTDHTT